MKVLHITTAYPYIHDKGIIPWLVKLLKKLREKGIEIEILTSSYRGRNKNEMQSGIPIYRFRYEKQKEETLSYAIAIPEQLKRNFLKTSIKVVKFLYHGFRKAHKISKERKFDIVHIHWPIPMALLGIPFIKFDIPLVFTFYTAELTLASKNSIFRFFSKNIIKGGDHFIFISSFTKNSFFSLFSEFKNIKYSILPFASSLEQAKMKRPKVNSKNNNILFVGRIVERKGIVYLIKAAEILKTKGYHFKVTIVGDGPDREKLKNMIMKKNLTDLVRFTGKVSDKELHTHYENSDLFVLPAIVDSKGDTEGLGVVLIESLIYGIPVVASKVGGIVDIVKDRKTGLLVEQKDSEKLAQAIITMLVDQNLRKKTVIEGQKLIKEYFSIESISEKLHNIYKTLTLQC